MASKGTKPKPDADGYLRTGIYQKYVGNPRKHPHRLTAKNLKAWVDGVNGPVEDYLGRIRTWLAKIILPHVDGPLTEQEIRQPVGRSLYNFDFGDGVKLYRDKADLHEHEQNIIDAFRDAVAAMGEIRLIECHLAPDGQATMLFQGTFRLGQLCERIQIRPFETLALSGRKAKIDRPQAMRKGKAAADKIKRREKRQRAEQALEWARQNYSMTNDNIDYLRGQAAKHTGIAKRTIYRWLTGK